MKSSLRDNFCSSPWFHIRISPEGNYRPCRWGDYSIESAHNISNTTLSEYLNSDIMSDIRTSLLNGNSPKLCESCQYESAHGKISGRQRQLLKSGISQDNFVKTFTCNATQSCFTRVDNKYTFNRLANKIGVGNWEIKIQGKNSMHAALMSNRNP